MSPQMLSWQQILQTINLVYLIHPLRRHLAILYEVVVLFVKYYQQTWHIPVITQCCITKDNVRLYSDLLMQNKTDAILKAENDLSFCSDPRVGKYIQDHGLTNTPQISFVDSRLRISSCMNQSKTTFSCRYLLSYQIWLDIII